MHPVVKATLAVFPPSVPHRVTMTNFPFSTTCAPSPTVIMTTSSIIPLKKQTLAVLHVMLPYDCYTLQTSCCPMLFARAAAAYSVGGVLYCHCGMSSREWGQRYTLTSHGGRDTCLWVCGLHVVPRSTCCSAGACLALVPRVSCS